MAPEAYFQLKIRRQGGRGWPVIAAATRLWVARVPLARAWGSTLSGEPLGWRPKRRAVALQRVRNTVFMQQGQGHTSKVRLPPSPCAHLSHAAVSLCLWFAAPTPLAVAPLPRSLLCPPGDAAPSPRSLLCPPGVALPLVAAPPPRSLLCPAGVAAPSPQLPPSLPGRQRDQRDDATLSDPSSMLRCLPAATPWYGTPLQHTRIDSPPASTCVARGRQRADTRG